MVFDLSCFLGIKGKLGDINNTVIGKSPVEIKKKYSLQEFNLSIIKLRYLLTCFVFQALFMSAFGQMRKDLDMRKIYIKMCIFGTNLEEIAYFQAIQVMKSKYILINHPFQVNFLNIM